MHPPLLPLYGCWVLAMPPAWGSLCYHDPVEWSRSKRAGLTHMNVCVLLKLCALTHMNVCILFGQYTYALTLINVRVVC
jgi:hypothetical protein